MLRVTLFWPFLACSCYEQKQQQGDDWRAHPDECPWSLSSSLSFGGKALGTIYMRTFAWTKSSTSLWKDYHESCLLKSLPASWILTTFFSEETWPLVMLKFKSWMLRNIMLLGCQNDKAIHPSASDRANFFLLQMMSLLPFHTTLLPLLPQRIERARNHSCLRVRREAQAVTEHPLCEWGATRAWSHFTQAQSSLSCFAE